jgi:carboxyl-terminal processing protease
MRTRNLVFASLLLLVALGLGLASHEDLAAQNRREGRSSSREVMESLELFGRVYEKLTRNYVDELDAQELVEKAIEGMLKDLDPHTQLLTEEVYDDLMVSTQGEFGGLGIQITIRDDYPTVITPIDDTPAFRLGIQGGDQIVEIEGESTFEWTTSQTVNALRGPKGTKVNIGIQRAGNEKIMPFTIERDIIKVESVPYAFMADEEQGIGYIRIANFSRTTAEELDRKIEALEAEGMGSLILDLRFNPGGLLQAAKEVSELFLEKGDLIVYTRGRLAQQNMSYFATSSSGKKWQDHPLVVMINGSSASASEILAGAIQDHDIGLVVGKNSFGKGSVQTVFELTPKEALKLTTARYYTPSGRSIHRDRSRDGAPLDEEELLADADVDEEDVEPVDPELPREVFKTEMGREVLGGGGIMPDIQIEPTLLSDFEIALERDATYFQFANLYLVDHPEMPIDFHVSDEMLDEFWELAGTREDLPAYFGDVELEMSRELFDENRDSIAQGIRREVVRRLYGSMAAYRVSLERDGQVWRAVDLLRENSTPEKLFRAAADWQAGQENLAEVQAPENDMN